MKRLFLMLGIIIGIIICALYAIGYAVEQEQGW